MKTVFLMPIIIVASVLLAGCQTAQQHRSGVEDQEGTELTVGIVQKEIRVGMSGSEVAAALGSPNIVTTDEQRREVWIYDRISTTDVYSRSSGYGTLLLIGGSRDAGARSKTQKSFTVIIKFDSEGLVRDFAYHTSKF
jgi:outer membrane protein assembly factor BamE (lipoprotein component of BamABCDE complex)